MESPSVRRSASTALLVVAALISATALSGQVQGFHPLGVVGALLPMQCAALFWAWQRVRD